MRGYRILAANVRAGGAELDLIVRRGRQLVFCEVKSKVGEGFGEPAEMVGAAKQARLVRAADTWLATRPELGGLEVSFEVLAVRSGRVERVRDAFSRAERGRSPRF